jgi:alpha-galactosidase
MLGYELNILNMSEEVKTVIAAQIKQYKSFEHVIRLGDHYTLAFPTKYPYSAYYYALPDASEVVFTVIEKGDCPAGVTKRLKIKAVRPDAVYIDCLTGKAYQGEELRAGLAVELTGRGNSAHLYHFKQV